MQVTDEMVNRFLAWPLPDSVCSDGCVTQRDYGKSQGWPKRSGTNLLNVDEARAMLEYVLSEREDIVVAASDKDESGWLVELPRHSVRLNETPLWWAGGGIKPHMVFDEPVWTLDAVKAVRFCRKEDAIRAIASWEDVGLIRQVKILEHLFLKG